jgi:putative hydrolase of the HAD superfamily
LIVSIEPLITTLFVDIGGVLLTNGWDHNARHLAAEHFHLDEAEMGERHHLTFDTYEVGKLSLDEYLDRTVFYEPRPFSRQDFKDFMYAQSRPYPEMIEMVHDLKIRYGLKVAAVSNEGRELTIHRIKKFELNKIIEFFISSCFVHFRKPDEDIYKLALDVAQAHPEQVVYIEDRAMFVDVANKLGIHGILHKDLDSTAQKLEELGAMLTFNGHGDHLHHAGNGSSHSFTAPARRSPTHHL